MKQTVGFFHLRCGGGEEGPQCFCQLIFGTLASSSAASPWLYKQTTAWSSLPIKHGLIKSEPPRQTDTLVLRALAADWAVKVLPSIVFKPPSPRPRPSLSEGIEPHQDASLQGRVARQGRPAIYLHFHYIEPQHASRRHQSPQRNILDLPPYLSSPCDAYPVSLQAVKWRHKLHVNQHRVCPEVALSDICQLALQPFVNAICLIALYQYTDEMSSLTEGRGGPSIYFNASILPWSPLMRDVHAWGCPGGPTDRLLQEL